MLVLAGVCLLAVMRCSVQKYLPPPPLPAMQRRICIAGVSFVGRWMLLAGVCLLAVMRCSVQKCVLVLEEVCVFGLGVIG